MNPNNHISIQEKIEGFLSKYYRNRLLKGAIIVCGSIIIYLFITIVGEYLLYLPSWLKMTILGILIVIAAVALFRFIIIPTLQIYSIGRDLTHKDAAKIIGNHFPDIQDKLFNILELKETQNNAASHALVAASIDQKTRQLSPFKFTNAIDLSVNRKYLPLAIIPLVVAILTYFIQPKIFQDGGYRLFQANKTFTPPAPFSFQLINKTLEVPYNESINISLSLTGKEIPTEAFIIIDKEKIPMVKDSSNVYSYTITNVTKPVNFVFEAAGYYSTTYRVNILSKPKMNNSTMVLNYPSFSQKESEKINGITDVTVPTGTNISISINADNTERVWAINAEGEEFFYNKNNNTFSFIHTANKNNEYTIYLSNDKFFKADSIAYSVTIIQDQAPTISIKEVKEKITGEQTLLIGTAADDYGLTSAQFVYSINNGKKSKTINLPLTGRTSTTLQQYFDIGSLNLNASDQVTYYIQVRDNGGNTSRSQTFEYKIPKGSEATKAIEQQSEEINNTIAQTKDASKEMEQQLNKMKEDALKNTQMNAWEQKQNMEMLQEQQEKFKEALENIQKRMESQKKLQEEKNYNDNIKEQQEEIEKKIENMKEKQLSEQMKKLQDLLQKKNENKPTNDIQELQKLMEDNKLFNMDMEQLQAMIENLEAQMMMEELADKMNALADKQDKLEQKTPDQSIKNESLKNEQDALKKEIDKMMEKDIKDIKEKSKKGDIKDEEDMAKDAGKDMKESSDNLDKGNNESSKKNQKSASSKLRQMSSKLKQKAAGLDAEQIEIDIKATRQLLTNLLRLSFDQEDIIYNSKKTQPSSNKYTELIRDQYRLRVGAAQIKDSLIALSHRALLIGPTINREIVELENRLKESTETMEERNPARAATAQQYAMTSSNNLALLLNELLSNLMQMQSQASGSGEGKSDKPMPGGKGKGKGKGNSSSPGDMMKDIISGQQKMGKGMSELKKEGGSPTGKQPGGKDGKDGSGSGGEGSNGEGEGSNMELSEQLSRMAFEQAKLRNQMQQLNSLMNSKGIKGNAALMKEIMEKMDKLETELINRKINQKNLEQQQSEILTRLLKAEDAIRQQEQDNKRQGEQGIDKPRPIPAELQKYIEQQRQLKDLYRTTPPTLKPYYKKIADEYLQRINL